jgi:hypothetical protein
MRLWVIPIFAIGAVLGVPRHEPSEGEMQTAFAAALALQVRNALDFARASGGEAAVQAIREAGTDRFSIARFHKVACEPLEDGAYICGFTVDLDLVGGTVRHTLSGRFSAQQSGYVFAEL